MCGARRLSSFGYESGEMNQNEGECMLGLHFRFFFLSSLKLNFKRERVAQPKPFTRTKVELPNA